MKTNIRLKHFLKDRGVKQSHVAEKIGMKGKAFNAILNDHADLRADTLESVCEAIGVSPSIFFEYRVQENGTNTEGRNGENKGT